MEEEGRGVTVSGAGQLSRGKTGNSDRSAFSGLAAFIAATTMLLAALTSAYVVRRGLAGDWTPVPLSPVLPGSVLLFVLSSVGLEWGRRSFKRRRPRAFAGLWFGSAAIGAIFMLSQVYAYKQVIQDGIFPAANPAAAFRYVLIGTFGLFVVGAMAALVWTGVRASRSNSETAFTRLTLAAWYWHYLDGLWAYLVILFYIRS